VREDLEKEAATCRASSSIRSSAIGGLLPRSPASSSGCREVTARHKIVLIFDEVISFRIARGGAQEKFGVTRSHRRSARSSVAASRWARSAARADVMAHTIPARAARASGTAGRSTPTRRRWRPASPRSRRSRRKRYERLDALGERLRGGVTRLLEETRRKGQITGVGSLFCLHWRPGQLTDYRSTRPKDPTRPMRVFSAC
jgi:glutamate-1-semialdehyde 2,1-aminomutase